jgi:tryptophan synthase beta chain
MLQDADGQVIEAVSISAGLDYPGIGPQLSALMEAGRLIVSSATDAEAVAALRQVARTEGILAAVESSHAVAALPDVLAGLAAAPLEGRLPREAVVVLGLSGRGDKDLAALGEAQSRAAIGGADSRAALAGAKVPALGEAQSLDSGGLKEVGR